MEGHKPESAPGIIIEEISASNEKLLQEASQLVTQYSWGEEYPKHPSEEIQAAEYSIGAKAGDTLVGFATVTRNASPDGIDNESLWLAHAVVTPEFRQQGIFEKLYAGQIHYAQSASGRILSCTDNPIVEKFFLAHGWKKLRETKDEAGDECDVFEYERSE